MDSQPSDKGSYRNCNKIFDPHGVVPPIGPRTDRTPQVPEHRFDFSLETFVCSGRKASSLTRTAKWGSVRNTVAIKLGTKARIGCAGCPERALLSEHSNQSEKAQFDQESDRHDRDRKERVARRERVHECCLAS